MSAQIPSTMLLSDLLKATGYDCPEELQGRTFEEATAGGDVQTNKESTIDVSTYTEPIVIKPDTDYESMKKNTVTLSNIPAVKTEEDLSVTENGEYTPEEGKTFGKVTVVVPPVSPEKLYFWKKQGYTNQGYTFSETPSVGDAILLPASDSGSSYKIAATTVSSVNTENNTITVQGHGTDVWVRDSSKDVTL